MQIIDNVNSLLGEDLRSELKSGSKLKIAASCFSIYAFEALKQELESIESLQFVFTSPTFIPNEVTDQIRKERREFHIPKAERERSFYGGEFEIQLKNKLTQKAIARECAEWGAPSSKQRLDKFCRTIEALIRQNKNRPGMGLAVSDWQEDLLWVRDHYAASC